MIADLISEAHGLVLNLTDKMDLGRDDKRVTLLDLNIYNNWENIKNSYQNMKINISGTTWDKEFELPGGFYSVSNIQDYSQYIIKKHETASLADKRPVQIYVNKTQNRITFKIKTGCYWLLHPNL